MTQIEFPFNSVRSAGGVRVGWCQFLVTALVLYSSGLHAEEASGLRTEAQLITVDNLKQHLTALADDVMEGREAGSRGGRAAGNYIGLQMQKFNLAGGAADLGYYQSFNGSMRNILARLEGSDPELKQQVIVICAHYDHVGRGSKKNSLGPLGLIHNGADDNASGTSGVLEVARAFTSGAPPKRTILFAFWDGEEIGLLGSKHWLANSTLKTGQVQFVFNTDMIGRYRPEKFEILGSRTAAGLRQFISNANAPFQFPIDFTWELKENSDHYPFAEKNIPLIMPFTGLHEDYHRPTDKIEKLNIEGIRDVARFVYQMAWDMANTAELPKFRSSARQETPERRRYIEQAPAALPLRLGITWDEKKPEVAGLRVATVYRGSSGEKVGLQVGDQLLKFDGHDITSLEELRRWVMIAPERVELTVQKPNKPQPDAVPVVLAGIPIRYGFFWRIDDAEPECVILQRIVPGSPADVGGLQINDRIWQVNGEDFPNEKTFGEKVRATEGSVTLKVERKGRVSTVKLQLFDPPK